MAIGFPPEIVFPLGIDSDTTLYLVYNTSESKTVSDNQPWAEEIEITAVDADKAEIWADNGFANISGELFYYDAVEKDSDGKVFKLKRCARNLGGKRTQFNKAGTWVRGFVIAEHHNQLVDAIIAIENFVGTIPCTDPESLICRLNEIDQPDCLDDSNCPNISFSFKTNDTTTNCEGIVADYVIQIEGNFTTFRLDFGDGAFTTTDLIGQHTYAPNSTIDPVVTVSNPNCQIVQTPITRLNPEEPQPAEATAPFEIPIPEVLPFPNITIPNNSIPETTLTLPQIVIPGACAQTLGISGIILDVSIPSTITISPVNIPSVITFTNVPTFSPIGFGPAPSFSPISFTATVSVSPIGFGPAPSISPIGFATPPSFSPIGFATPPSFSPIGFGPAPTFTPISFGPGPTFSPISVTWGPTPSITLSPFDVILSPLHATVDWGPTPSISVTWGPTPTLSCVVTVSCDSTPAPLRAASLGEDFTDGFGQQGFTLDVSDLGIPSEITITPPVFPDINVKHNIPEKITVESVPFPDKIDVQFVGERIPDKIVIVSEAVIPDFLEIRHDIPRFIDVNHSIPEVITLEVPENASIKLDVANLPDLQVKGFPDSIELKGPSEIVLKVPEEIEVKMVYKGGPVPVQMDLSNLSGEGGEDAPCFTLVQCPPRK